MARTAKLLEALEGRRLFSGDGLKAQYFDNMDFSGTSISRVDSTVDFNWDAGSPASGIGADTFSARWTGQVQPEFSETYSFITRADDGVRLWVNGKLLINDWSVHAAREQRSAKITLEAGQKYDIRMDYFENRGGALASLSWESARQPRQVIPTSRLYSGVAAPTPTVGSVTGLALVNADTLEPLSILQDGSVVNLEELSQHMTLQAQTEGVVESVRFDLDGSTYRTENVAPYLIAGQVAFLYGDTNFDGVVSSSDYFADANFDGIVTGDDYIIVDANLGTTDVLVSNNGIGGNPWSPAPGVHTLTVTPFSQDDAGGLAGAGITISFTVLAKPAPASGLAATNVSPDSVQLDWADQSNNESGFVVERSLDGTAFVEIARVAADVTSFIDTTVLPGTSYSYRIVAVNEVGASASTNVVTVATPVPAPAAPSSLVTLSVAATEVKLAWTDNSEYEAGFIIERSVDGLNFTEIGATAPNVTTLTDSTVAPGQNYWYRVRATNSGGDSANSDVLAVTTPVTVPDAPTTLGSTSITTNQVQLEWTDNSQNESGFAIERSANGADFVQIGSVSANVTSYTDSGLSSGTSYWYRVVASNAAGTSTASNVLAVKTATPPPPTSTPNLLISSLSLMNADTGQAIVTLTDGATLNLATLPSRNLNVRAHVSTLLGVTVGSVQFMLDGSVFRTESNAPYALAGDYGTGYYAWTPAVGAHTLKVTPFTLAGGLGLPGVSTTVNFTVTDTAPTPTDPTPTDPTPTDPVPTPTPTIPAAPQNLTATTGGSSKVTLSWADLSSDESGFKIERSTDGLNFTQIASVGANVKSYINTGGLTASTKYYYRVRAFNVAGDSGYSNVASATTAAPTPAPSGFPNASNTGPNDRSILREVGSMTITEEGAVIENFILRGGTILIKANNVTIRNFIIENPITTGAAIRFDSNDITGGLVEYGEIYGGTATNGVSGSNYTARRLHIHHMQSDCFRVKVNVTIEECYLHDFSLGENAHGDGVQMYPTDGGGMRIINNHIDATGANAALFQVEYGWHIEGNYLTGGNYTIYTAGAPEQVFINNTWGRTYKYGTLYVGRGDKSLFTWEGNKWVDGSAYNL